MGIVLLLLGILIQYQIRKRKFNRRTSGGSEAFSSYGNSILTRFMEGIFRLISILMILLGIYMLSIPYLQPGRMHPKP